MLDQLAALDQTVVFIVFVTVMVIMAVVIFIANDRDIKRKQIAHEAQMDLARKRMAEITKANTTHMTAVDALFHIHHITKAAIEQIDKEKK